MSHDSRPRTLPYSGAGSSGPRRTAVGPTGREHHHTRSQAMRTVRAVRAVRAGRAGRAVRGVASLGAAVAAVLALASVGAAAAGADTPPPSSTGSSGSGGSSGSSSAGSSSSGSPSSSLGGFQTSATGSGISWSYEQPNFPVPATPTFELNLGFSQTSYNAGPTGESLASTLWPGQVAANALSQIGLLLQPYFGKNTPNLAIPPWPVQASTSYPPGPSTPSSSSQDSPGITMEANSTQDAGDATSTFGTSNGKGNSYVLPSGFISVQSIGSAVRSTVINGQAVAQATSNVHGVSMAGGLITIGQITSAATATSDGNQGKEAGTSTVSQVAVAGQAVTLDSSGLHAAGHDAPAVGSVLSNVQGALQAAGVSLTLTNPTDTTGGSSATRQLDGVQIKIDLTTLDKQINRLVAGLPQQLQTQVIDQLPLPPPNAQILTVDLGWVNVQAAASPGYNSDTSSANSADQGAGGSGAANGGGASGFGAGDVGGAGSNVGGKGGPGGIQGAAATAPAGFFRGIGASLITLGLLLALLLAAVLWRADKAVGALTAAAPCTGEDS